MGFLFARNKKNAVPEVTGLQIQTAVNTVAISICYGTPRVPINIIYANGFRSVKGKSGSGGKGLFGSGGGKGAVTGVKYYSTFIGAICEGEVTTIAAMFENANVYTVATLPAGKSITFFNGSSTQTPWSVISSNWPEDAFAYRHTSYCGFDDYELDSSGTIPQINFLIVAKYAGVFPLYRYTAPDTTTWLFDADPASCVWDFLTNPTYGVMFPEAYIDTLTLFTSPDGFDPDIGDAAVATYCQAVGLGWSVCLNNPEPASTILDRWFKNLVVAPVWTGTQLKFIPYADTRYSLNPGYDDENAEVARKYYTPNITPLFSITDDDFIQSEGEEDPIILTRVDPRDAKNVVRVNFRDRYNYFNDNVAQAQDELAMELYGPRLDNSGAAEEYSLMAYAANSAQLQLQRNQSVRLTAAFKLPPQWVILEPMDIIVITETNLGLTEFPVRIRSVQEDEKGLLDFICEEFRAGSMQPILYNRQNNKPPIIISTDITAPSINPPIMLEPTAELLAARGESNPTIMIALSGGPNGVFDPNWGGADVYLSLDDITYQQFGTANGPANMGVTSTTLPAYVGANPDNVDTLLVNLTESEGSLVSVSDAAAATGQSLVAVVDDDGTYELIGYTNAILVGPSQYNLTGLYRGMYGTQACEHGAGSGFVRLDSLVFETPLQPAFIGKTVYGKFPSFNIFHSGLQDLSQATAYPYTPKGFGVGISTNQLALALMAPGPYTVDLSNFIVDVTLDLGAITGECAPVSFNVDLDNT
jgi:hypothetical protein